ncbi:DUF1559 domain-containing protein [Durusdinium trenchii]|uniref:DUF1559 domain-containing protein n=1 Tax=Durusdinium trenchii TaxID=1381693 RepID=A0ABP0KHG8_9DINO
MMIGKIRMQRRIDGLGVLAAGFAATYVLVVGIVWWRSFTTPGDLSSHRKVCSSRVENVLLALRRYHDKYERFPPVYTVDVDGRPLHSWRTLLLPYLNSSQLIELYRRLDLSVPWDHSVNRQVLEELGPVAAYQCPADTESRDETATSIVAVVGPHTCWWPGQEFALRDLTLPSETIMVVEIADSGIHWMEPRDLYTGQMAAGVNPASGQGISSEHGGAHLGMADGSKRRHPLRSLDLHSCRRLRKTFAIAVLCLLFELAQPFREQWHGHAQGFANSLGLQRALAGTKAACRFIHTRFASNRQPWKIELIGESLGELEGTDPLGSTDVVQPLKVLEAGSFDDRRKVGRQDRCRMANVVLLDHPLRFDLIEKRFDPALLVTRGRPAEGVRANQQGFGNDLASLLLGGTNRDGLKTVTDAGALLVMKHPGAGEDGIRGDHGEAGLCFLRSAAPGLDRCDERIIDCRGKVGLPSGTRRRAAVNDPVRPDARGNRTRGIGGIDGGTIGNVVPISGRPCEDAISLRKAGGQVCSCDSIDSDDEKTLHAVPPCLGVQ